jgi:hypothetical protein
MGMKLMLNAGSLIRGIKLSALYTCSVLVVMLSSNGQSYLFINHTQVSVA